MAKKHKRFRRKGHGADAQVDQRLSKTVRELYQGVGDEDDFEDQWHQGWEGDLLGDEPAGSPSSKHRPKPRPAKGAAPARSAADEISLGERHDGVIVALASGIAWVEDADGIRRECSLPTKLATDQQSSVAVGDRVVWAPVLTEGESGGSDPDGAEDLRVVEVEPRHTELSRPDPLNPRLQRVVAANVDVVVQVASVVEPPLRPALIDRYLIAIQRGGAQPLLCINKVDLLDEAARRRVESELEPYVDLGREIGMEIVWASAETGEGLEELRRHLTSQVAAFVGHSGVGKSSLINALEPEIDAATAAVSRSRGTGRHTTTRSDLYDLGGIRLIDTPGIREMGLWNLDPRALPEYFPEFTPFAPACKFRDCSHLHEPECAVRRAVEDDEISRRRYETYLRILETLGDDPDAGRP